MRRLLSLLALCLPLVLVADSVTYTYDSLNRLVKAVYADGTTIAYSYDSSGNRLALVISNPNGTLPSQVTLTSPSSGATNQSTTPTLNWSASSKATSYDLYLGTSNPPPVYAQNLSGISFGVTTALSANTPYFWNVIAKNSSGSAPASSTWSFTTTAPVVTPTLHQTATCSGAQPCSFPSGASAGDLIVVLVANGTGCTVTSTPPNVFLPAVSTIDSEGVSLGSYYSGSVAAGTNSIRVACSGYPYAAVLDISGVSVLDQAGIANGTSQIASVSTSGSVTSSAAYVVAAAEVSNAVPTFVAGSGYTNQVPFFANFAEVEDMNARTGLSGTQTASFDSGHAGAIWASLILTFKSAGAVPGQVTLTSPSSGATGQSTTPTLSWSASSNATSYDLYLGTSNSPPVYVQNLLGTSFSVTTALTAGSTYYWNVVAKNSAGSAPASGTWSFTTAPVPGQVTLTSPANGAANQSPTPTLSWSAASNATSYDLYLGTSNPPALYSQNLPGTSFTVSTALSAGAYYWNVVAKNGAGSALASTTWTFTTVGGGPPVQVTLTSPVNGATNQSATPTLNWSASANATSYDLYLGTSNTPGVYAQNLSGTSFAVSTALSAGSTYYWYVIAKNGAGSAPASSTWSFTTAAALPGQVTLTSPGNGVSNQSTTPTVSWSASSNATSYDLYLGTSNPPGEYVQNLLGTSFTVSTALSAGSTYYWYVIAKNGAGSAPASSTWSFTTASSGGGCAGGAQTFITPGTTSWTVPVGCTQAVFEVWGGGAPGWVDGYGAQGGGGGGGYRTSGTSTVVPGTTYSVIVSDVARVGAASGGISHVQLSGTDIVTVTAAAHGLYYGSALGGSGSQSGGKGGVGGGGAGAGGGGGAGTTDGMNGSGSSGSTGGAGGVGGTTGGNGGNGGNGNLFSSCTNGQDGIAPGGGGGGAGDDGSGTCLSGNGARGQTKITWLSSGGMLPGQVTLFGPVNGSTNLSLTQTLSWLPSANATSYDLYLGTSNPPAVYAQNQTSTSFTPSTALNASSTYYWYVVAKNSVGSAPPSIAWSFTTAGGSVPAQVTLTSPANGATNQSTTLTLSWSASANATSYDLYLGTSPLPGLYAQNLPGTTFAVSTTLNSASTFYWNVVAKNSWGSAPASSTWAFTTAVVVPAQVTLTSPANGATNQSSTPSLAWSASANATAYDVYLGSSNPPGLYAGNRLGSPELVAPALNAGTTYYWNVVAKNSAGSAPASSTWSFTTTASLPAQVTLTSPANGAAFQPITPTLNWSASSYAQLYDLYLGTSNPPGLYAQNLPGASLVVSTALSPGSIYYWYVIAKNSVGSAPASSIWSFTTWPVPGQVTLTSPVNGATNQSTTPTLSWSASGNATSYDVYLGTSNTPGVYAQNLSGTNFAVSTALNAGSTYYWYVIAKDSAGSAPASTTWSFTTASSGGGCAGGSQTFITPGTTSWTVPAGCTQAVFEVWGGGAPGWVDGYGAQGGGGGGGYRTSGTSTVVPGTTYSVIVSDVARSGSATGGISHVQLSGTDIVTVTAAARGSYYGSALGGSGSQSGGKGGVGGGGAGAGGGGGAGTTNGMNGSGSSGSTGGAGGVGGTTGGNGGNGGNGNSFSSCTNGQDGIAPGGGGGGAGEDGSGTCLPGNGARGQAKITWLSSGGTLPGQVTLTSPANGATNQSTTLTLSWSASGNATSYDLYLGTSNTPGVYAQNLSGTSFAVSTALSAGSTYYWYVIAKNSAGSAPASTTWSFATTASVPGQVTLTSPVNGATNQSTTLTLSWSASANATSYDLYLGTTNTPGVYAQNLSGTSFAVSTALSAGSTYYWYVIAKNSAGSAPASTTWSFATTASVPGQVTLTSPVNGATNQSTTLTLSWSASANATSYDVYLGTSSTPGVYAQNLSGTSFAVSTALSAGSTYYWYVIAKNSVGSAPASTTWSFATTASVPGQVTLTSPVNGATNQSTTPTLNWSLSANATSYDLYLGTSNSPPAYVQNLSGISYTMTTALNTNTTYSWNVVAKNSAGSAPASNTWSFTTAPTGGGGGTPTLRQTATCSGQPVTCSFSSGATAGDLIVVFVASGTGCTVTSTPSNAFFPAVSTADSEGISLGSYYSGSVAPGTNAIRVACSGYPYATALDISGVSVLDQTGSANSTSQITSVTTSGAVIAGTEYVVAAAEVSNVIPTFVAGSGYTNQAQFFANFAEVEDKNARTGLAGTQTASFDSGHIGAIWASLILTFK